ncbi:MAG: hypothetical protein ACE366_21680 [Bradymonadia bacterium]
MNTLKNFGTAACLTLALGAFGGCADGDDIYIVTGEGGATGEADAGARQPARDAAIIGGELDFTSTSKIEAYLDGKVLLMAGADTPSHPNGFDENVNFGQATQCYNLTEITVLGTQWTTRTVLGNLENAPETGDVGTCNRDVEGIPLEFVSTAVVLTNIEGNGECFDVTATYPGFGQEGRGRISADGSTIELEFYFKDQAVGHRCADGAVGAPGTVFLNGADTPFEGNAVMLYRISEAP